MKKLLVPLFVIGLSVGGLSACTNQQVGTSIGAGAGAGLGYALTGSGWGAAAGGVGGALAGQRLSR